MSQEAGENFKQAGRVAALWAGLLSGPMAWMISQQAGNFIVSWACSPAGRVALHLVMIAALLLAGAGGLVSWRCWRRAGREWPDDSGGAVPRSRFLAVLGLMMSGLFSLLIAAQWIPSFFFDPCQRLS